MSAAGRLPWCLTQRSPLIGERRAIPSLTTCLPVNSAYEHPLRFSGLLQVAGDTSYDLEGLERSLRLSKCIGLSTVFPGTV